MEELKQVSLMRLFAVFAKIGAFTLGGGYAMIPLIQDELSRRGWLSDEELPDIVALSQSVPGIMAVNISIFAGYRLRGIKGSIAATLGSVMPSFVIVLLIAMVFTNFKEMSVVTRIFSGIRPVVTALIAVPMLNMARSSNKTPLAWVLSAGALVMVAFLGVSPIYIILGVLIVSTVITCLKERK